MAQGVLSYKLWGSTGNKIVRFWARYPVWEMRRTWILWRVFCATVMHSGIRSNKIDTQINSTTIAKDVKNIGSKRRKEKLLIWASHLLTSSPLVQRVYFSKPAILLIGSHNVRLHNNVALRLASFHAVIIPVFIRSWNKQRIWEVQGEMEVVLKDTLWNLHDQLEEYGSSLIFQETKDFLEGLKHIRMEVGACTVCWNKEYVTKCCVRTRTRQQGQAFLEPKIHKTQVPCARSSSIRIITRYSSSISSITYHQQQLLM